MSNKYHDKAYKTYLSKKKDDYLKDLHHYKPRIAFFTGAGISAESGLATFRDSDGLWNNYTIEEIATKKALMKNQEKVNNFYNMRRREVVNAQPNKAHHLIKELEKFYDVSIITQNVDNLHEKAGSQKIFHLHGEIMKSQSIANRKYIYEQTEDIKIGDKCVKSNAQLRPHIVLFDELLDEKIFYDARKAIREADILVIVGSTLKVNPAASLVFEVINHKKVYLIDPVDPLGENKVNFINKKASEGMSDVFDYLLVDYKNLIEDFENKKTFK